MITVGLVLVSAATTAPCSIVDEKYAAQYVRYDHHGTVRPSYGDESSEHVWLRLHNNTSCRIRIPAGLPLVIRELPDGTRTIDPQDGQEVWMEVEVTDPRTGLLAYPHSRVGALTHVPGGQSVTFALAANLLKRGPIGIPFEYDWDTSGPPRGGRVEHRLLFDPQQLPDDVLAWLRSVKEPPAQATLSPSRPGRRLSGAPAFPSANGATPSPPPHP